MQKLKIDSKGLKELIKTEGYRDQVYDDRTGKKVASYSQVSGYPTIGVGHLIRDSERDKYSKYLVGSKKMSKKEVMSLLSIDVERFEKSMRPKIKQPITQSMWNALVSLAFNAGAGSYAVRNAINAINIKDYDGAAKAILNGPTTSKGRKLEGLVKRRRAEAMMFLEDGLPKSGMGLGGFALLASLGFAVSQVLL